MSTEISSFKSISPQSTSRISKSTVRKGHNEIVHYDLTSIFNLSKIINKSKSVIVLNCTINGISANALIDTGAGANFISSKLVQANLSQFKTSSTKVNVTIGDNRRLVCDEVIKKARVKLLKKDHQCDLIVLPTMNFDAVLGIPWLNLAGAVVDIRSQQVKCSQEDVITINRKQQVDSVMDFSTPVASQSSPKSIPLGTMITNHRSVVHFNQMISNVHKFIESSFTLSPDESLVVLNAMDVSSKVEAEPPKYKSISDIEHPLARQLVAKYKDVFVSELPSGLPPHRDIEFRIETVEGEKPPSIPPYKMSGHELEHLSKLIKELLDKKLIRPSESPYGAPVILIRKKDGSFRLCLDYRKLNDITVKNAYGLPRVDEMFDRLSGAKIFTQLDCQSGYWQIRVKESDISKTAFRSRVGHYEWMVMPQGVTNGPATFSALMQHIFSDIIDKYFICYLDDMLIYSKNESEHYKQCENVFRLLRQHKLYCQLTKCRFFVNQVYFLGHKISQNGISMQQDKVKAIMQWPIPSNIKQLRGFLGLTGYYRKFIKSYSLLTAPLTDALKGKRKFE
jgi:predicted aspartyl protease